MSAEIVPLRPKRLRGLTTTERHLLARALESWSARALAEADQHAHLGNADVAEGFDRQAALGAELHGRIKWMRVPE